MRSRFAHYHASLAHALLVLASRNPTLRQPLA
jgi:hypothetical protein